LETLVKLTEDKKRQESHIEAIDEAAKQGEVKTIIK